MKVVKIELLGAPCYLSFTGEAIAKIATIADTSKMSLEDISSEIITLSGNGGLRPRSFQR